MEKPGSSYEKFYKSREYFEAIWKRIIDLILNPLPSGRSSFPFIQGHERVPWLDDICNYPEHCKCEKCIKREETEQERKQEIKEEIEKREKQNRSSITIEDARERRKKELERFHNTQQYGQKGHTMERK